ncbi:MAG: ribbon-helix-helix protein, CopG family [Candidatus Rokubacteria bacterium]|nr:ribbon-helix-helix protein, CopG family [Candidatus Rokubacteria bacterium]
MRTSKILSFSLPPNLLREAERVAKREGRTKSELFREALRRYLLEERVRRLQRYGARQARKLGIKASQVEQLIEEYRKAR